MGEGKDGKVVDLFTRRAISQPVAEAQTAGSEDAPSVPEIAGNDFEFFTNNRALLPEIAERANQIEMTISTLRGYARSERNIGIRAEGLKAASLSDLCESLLSSNSGMWTQKPSYYLAVIAEFSKRIDAFSRRTRSGGESGPTFTAEEMVIGDTLFVLHNSSRAIEACRKIDVITVYVMDECGIQPNHAEMGIHQASLSGHALSQLCDLVLDSPKDDWKARPNFYGAVIMELDERTKAVQSVLRRGDSPE
jgi:hypothetical protein